MDVFFDTFSFMAGIPAMAGLILTAVTIFLASDWRLSLTALLVQYLLVGFALSRFIQGELALVKLLVGVLAVAILYLSARRVQEAKAPQTVGSERAQFSGMRVGWNAGPLGLPLRLLTVVMVALAVLLFFDDFRPLLPLLGEEQALVPADIAFVAFWMGGMGLVGLVLSGEPLRVAPALLTILAAFDLIYSGLEPEPGVVGLWGALTLLGALAFSYLAIVQGLGGGQDLEQPATEAVPDTLPNSVGLEEATER